MSFFNSTSLFSSSVAQLIDTAIDSNSIDNNISMYLEICDMINSKEENAKEAMKSIRKKLSLFAGRDWNFTMKLLNLLEVSSANCTKKFQLQLANKEFLQELRTIIGPKMQPPLSIQEKVLYLIQLWATTFKNDSDFKTIESVYTELRSKGVDFPIGDKQSVYSREELLDKQEKLPVNELKSTLNSIEAAESVAASLAAQASSRSVRMPNSPQHVGIQRAQIQSAPGSAVRLNEEQMAKLQSELDVVDNNIYVMNELLNEIQKVDKMNLQSADVKTDILLLQEINKTCQEMQKRITQLIGNISNENIIGDLLRINDDLNNSFTRYQRLEKSFTQNNEHASTNTNKNNDDNVFKSPKKEKIPKESKVEEKPLIDFSDDTRSKSPLTADQEFLQDENEIKEMEQWLKTQGATLPTGIKYKYLISHFVISE